MSQRYDPESVERFYAFMRRNKTLLTLCAIVFAFLLGTAVATNTSDERDGVRVTLESLTKEMDRKEELLNALNASVADLAVLQTRLTSEIATIKAAAESDITTHRATLMGKVDAAVAEKRLEISALEGKLAAYKAQLAQLRDFDTTEKAALAKLAALQAKIQAVAPDKANGAIISDDWQRKYNASMAWHVFKAAETVCFEAKSASAGWVCMDFNQLDAPYANYLRQMDGTQILAPLVTDIDNDTTFRGHLQVVDFNTGSLILFDSNQANGLHIIPFSKLPEATRKAYEEMRAKALAATAVTDG